jgi:putative ABC transport system substrate-binding protein
VRTGNATGGSPLLASHPAELVDLALRARKPMISVNRYMTQRGLLVSYGPNLVDRAGSYAAKILAGAKPGDLPIEQATKFNLAINLKTAKALGLSISREMLLRADEVLE